jgi:hypothetical protein
MLCMPSITKNLGVSAMPVWLRAVEIKYVAVRLSAKSFFRKLRGTRRSEQEKGYRFHPSRKTTSQPQLRIRFIAVGYIYGKPWQCNRF